MPISNSCKLNVYRKSDGCFSVGANELSLKKCLETKVDIFIVPPADQAT